jgi:glyoxalase family protein
MQLSGIHHLTAITADASRNHGFFTRTLGMRLVKKTVNQDDVSAYHLFYADGRGTPGTDLTFFDWPLTRERRGTRGIVRTGLRVKGGATMEYWASRLREAGVAAEKISKRDGRVTLDFQDGEGQRMSLIADPADVGEAFAWEKSPVPGEHQIRGLGPITISVLNAAGTKRVLTELMEMKSVREYEMPSSDGSGGVSPVSVYSMGKGGAAAELHVMVEPGLSGGRQGAGGVHHVAFRVLTFEEHERWIERLAEFGMPSSGLVDRFYFRSLYFREPGGILFELATDGPGFAADEPMEHLGEHLALPPFLEGRRREIEAGLKPIE